MKQSNAAATAAIAFTCLAAWTLLAACSGAGPEAGAMAAPAQLPAPPAAVPAAAPAAALPATAAEARPAATAAPPRAAVPAEPTADASIELRNEIQRLVGSAPCRDDAQCRALPMGSKPCGGPEGYLAWSLAGTDARQLEALAARYKEARAARNQRLGLMSDCAVVLEPPVHCVRGAPEARDGRCQAQLVRGGAGAVAR